MNKSYSNILFLPFFLLCLSVSGQDLSDRDKTYLSTRVFGLIYEYRETETGNSINQRYLDLYTDLQKARDFQSFNAYLAKLVLLEMPSGGLFSEGTDKGSLQIDKLKENQPFPLKPDFEWIHHPLISKEVSTSLGDRIRNYHPAKREDLKKKGHTILHQDQYAKLEGDSSSIFSLGMIQFWNKIFYYHPYLKLMDQSWEEVLLAEYGLFSGMNTKKHYYDHIERLSAFIDDSHTFVSINDYQVWTYGFGNWKTFPVEANLMDGVVRITYHSDKPELSDLHQGDTITHINGSKINDYLDAKSRKIVASNKEDSIRQLNRKILPSFNHPGLGDSLITIRVRKKDYLLKTESVYYSDYNRFIQKEKPTEHQEAIEDIDPKAGYIHLVHADRREVKKAFKTFRNKEFLILDLRGYPPNSLITYLTKNLSKKAKPVASFYYPFEGYPGYFKDYEKALSYYVSNIIDVLLLGVFPSKGKIMPTSRKPYPGKIIALVNEQMISYAETVGMIIKSYRPEAIFVGRPSNGANGNVKELPLPYNVSVNISGLHWHYADKSELQRKGLEIDYYVPRNFQMDMQLKDPVLLKAIELVKGTTTSREQ